MDGATYLASFSLMAGMGTTMFSILLGFLIFIINSGARLSTPALAFLVTGVCVSILVAACSLMGIITYVKDAYNPAFVYGTATLLFVALGSVFTLAVLAVKQIIEDSTWP